MYDVFFYTHGLFEKVLIETDKLYFKILKIIHIEELWNTLLPLSYNLLNTM